LFPDNRLRKQIETLLPASGMASLTIRGTGGWAGLVVSLNQTGTRLREPAWSIGRETDATMPQGEDCGVSTSRAVSKPKRPAEALSSS